MAVAQRFNSFGTYLETLRSMEQDSRPSGWIETLRAEEHWSRDQAKKAILEAMGSGPTTTPALQAATGLSPTVIERVLEALLAEGVVARSSEENFKLTPFGDRLRRLLR